MTSISQHEREKLISDYKELFTKAMKAQWKKGLYDIQDISRYRKKTSELPSEEDFKRLSALL